MYVIEIVTLDNDDNSLLAHNNSKRIRDRLVEQQMGYGTICEGALTTFLNELQHDLHIVGQDEIFLDIGKLYINTIYIVI